jgi:Mn-dependent DtxR family transcriptional regulator
MTKLADRPTVSQDDYLERIFELIEGKGYARVADLAAELGVTQASASGMVKRLAQSGLLKREVYRGFQLTAQGRKRAAYIHKRHIVLAGFFAAIGVDEKTAVRDIDGIEHHLSEKTVAALERATALFKAR